MTTSSSPLQALARIRPDVRAMHAYAVQPSHGMLKMDAMENPFRLPAHLQAALGERLGGVALNRYPGSRVEDLKAALAQRGLEVRGQAERVLHRVHLEHAGGGLHDVRVHGAHVGADAGQGLQGRR